MTLVAYAVVQAWTLMPMAFAMTLICERTRAPAITMRTQPRLVLRMTLVAYAAAQALMLMPTASAMTLTLAQIQARATTMRTQRRLVL